MSLIDPTTRYDVFQELSSILKVYPNCVRLVVFKEPKFFHRYDYDQASRRRMLDNADDDGNKRKTKLDSIPTPEEAAEIEEKSRRRAKSKLVDLSLQNDFDLFATFTFNCKACPLNRKGEGCRNKRKEGCLCDRDTCYRFNVDLCKKRMGYWLNNQRHIHGAFRYLIAPEFHKDQKAIHFHALFGDYSGHLKDSGKKTKRGQAKHDIISYQLGLSTAIHITDNIEDHKKVANYVTKYVTKDMPRFHGKQRYWCSNGLKMPLKYLNPKLTGEDKAAFTSVSKSDYLEVFEINGQLSDNDLARICNYGNPREDDLRVAEW
jgi:hypothetical protein